jgi:steroid delta-isomerase
MNELINFSPDHTDSLQRLVDFFETLTIESVQQHLGHIYAADAYFKDPFSEVRGLPAMTPIFEHMFTQVANPRFVVTNTVLQNDDAFMTWDFLFHMPRYSSDEQCIRGATHLRFNPDGRVNSHRDYWDPAEELYEKLPVLGAMMRILKRIAKK